MQEKAKVSLSAFELQLVTDETFILTKNRIIQKVYELFGQCSENYKTVLKQYTLPEIALQSPAKIAKGENYEGLPYVMLDFPRCFGRRRTGCTQFFLVGALLQLHITS
jgi:hypothetical protein